MRSQPYLDTLITEVKQQVNAIQSREDFLTFYQWMNKHDKIIKLLEELDRLPLPLDESSLLVLNEDIESPLRDSEIAQTVNLTGTPSAIEPVESVIKDAEDAIGRVFSFVKKASGGAIEELNFHLNEEFIRRRHIEHGNLLKIMGIEGRFPDGKPRYSIEVIDHTETEHKSLIAVTQGIVEFLFGKYLIRRTTSETIKLDGAEVTLLIQERDVEKHDLKEGDIIDGRFYKNSLESFRVTYKFPIESSKDDKSIEYSRLTANRKKIKKENNMPTITMLDRLDTKSLKDKRILLIGLASRKTDFQSSLANYSHIQFEHLTGDEREVVMRNAIAQADVVLVNITENSHHATKLATVLCKDLNIPMKSTSADGLYMLLHTAKEFLEKTGRKKTQVI